MLLSRLVSSISPCRISGSTDFEIIDLAYDSRQVKPGTLFIAVPQVGGDARTGGSLYVEEAVCRGAVAVVTELDQDVAGVTTVQVQNARQSLADVSAEFFEHPSRDLRLYAVTGTDGKTTTSYFLEGILASAGYRTGLMGTVEVKIAGHTESNADRMTTPESLDLQRLLRRMVDARVTHAVLEASSHALALDRLRGCHLEACALTNLTGDHVEFHGSWQAYVEAKASLFTEIAPGCPAVLNRDDEHFEEIASKVTGNILTYGLDSRADLVARDLRAEERSTSFEMCLGGACLGACIPLPGDFNVLNALAAAGLSLSAGLSLEAIASGLKDVNPPRGRFQWIDEGQPFQVVIDYAHTTQAFQSMLRTLRKGPAENGRLIAVFGAAGNRDRAKRPQLARLAEKYTDYFVITNEDPFGEAAETIIDEIASGAKSEEGICFRREPDRARAIEMALQYAKPGDTVAVLGKGHEDSIVTGDRKEPWSDVAVVRTTLKRLS